MPAIRSQASGWVAFDALRARASKTPESDNASDAILVISDSESEHDVLLADDTQRIGVALHAGLQEEIDEEVDELEDSGDESERPRSPVFRNDLLRRARGMSPFKRSSANAKGKGRALPDSPKSSRASTTTATSSGSSTSSQSSSSSSPRPATNTMCQTRQAVVADMQASIADIDDASITGGWPTRLSGTHGPTVQLKVVTSFVACVRGLSASYRRMRDALRQAEGRAHAAEGQVQEAHERVAAAEAEVTLTRTKLADAEGKAKELLGQGHRRPEDLEEKLELAQRQLEHMQNHVEDPNDNLLALAPSRSEASLEKELRQALVMMEEKDAQLDKLRAEAVSRTEADAARKVADQEELVTARGSIADLQKELKRANGGYAARGMEIECLERQVKETKGHWACTRTRLDYEVKMAKQEIEALKAAAAIPHADSGRVQQLEDRATTLETNLADAKASRDEAKAAHKLLCDKYRAIKAQRDGHATTIATLERTNADLRAEKTDLERQHAAARDATATYGRLQQDFATLQRRFARVEADDLARSLRLDAVQQESFERFREIQRLAGVQDERDKAVRDKKAADTRERQAKAEVKALTNTLEQEKRDHVKTRDQLDKQRATRRQVRGADTDKSERIGELEGEVKQLKADLRTARADKKEAGGARNEAERQLKLAEARVDQLEQELADASTRQDTVNAALADAARDKAAVDASLQDKVAELDSLKLDKQALATKLAGMEETCALAETELKKRRAELEGKVAEVRDLKAKMVEQDDKLAQLRLVEDGKHQAEAGVGTARTEAQALRVAQEQTQKKLDGVARQLKDAQDQVIRSEKAMERLKAELKTTKDAHTHCPAHPAHTPPTLSPLHAPLPTLSQGMYHTGYPYTVPATNYNFINTGHMDRWTFNAAGSVAAADIQARPPAAARMPSPPRTPQADNSLADTVTATPPPSDASNGVAPRPAPPPLTTGARAAADAPPTPASPASAAASTAPSQGKPKGKKRTADETLLQDGVQDQASAHSDVHPSTPRADSHVIARGVDAIGGAVHVNKKARRRSAAKKQLLLLQVQDKENRALGSNEGQGPAKDGYKEKRKRKDKRQAAGTEVLARTDGRTFVPTLARG